MEKALTQLKNFQHQMYKILDQILHQDTQNCQLIHRFYKLIRRGNQVSSLLLSSRVNYQIFDQT
jgi:hypothetical protein